MVYKIELCKMSHEWTQIYAKFIKQKRKLTMDGDGGTQTRENTYFFIRFNLRISVVVH